MIPRIIYGTLVTAREWYPRRTSQEIQGDDHCPAGDCNAICREGDSNHAFNIAPNLLNRDFHADQPNQKWAGDISYVWTREGWLYLAVILDLHSRRVIGWAPSRDIASQCTAGQWCSNRMKRDLAIRALKPLGHCCAIPCRSGDGGRTAATAERLHPPYGPRVAILLT